MGCGSSTEGNAGEAVLPKVTKSTNFGSRQELHSKSAPVNLKRWSSKIPAGRKDSPPAPEVDDPAARVVGDMASRVSSGITVCEGNVSHTLPDSVFTIRYAAVSQTGYYPNAPDRTNQDTYIATTAFGQHPERSLFGVFDGHGDFGTECSLFSREKVPKNLLASKYYPFAPALALQEAVLATNQQLRYSTVPDDMSGTTAALLLVLGRSLCIANVGDSRIVLAEREAGGLVARDMTVDHTPLRKDERERVKMCGARVLTVQQMLGNKDPTIEDWDTTRHESDGDPPRLWSFRGRFPGTAFSRSIGDKVAEEHCGVVADPEVAVLQISSKMPFIVIASDGVFEFMPSQAVVDEISRHDNPLEAAQAIVTESAKHWLSKEPRTDDITIIIVQFVGVSDAVDTGLPRRAESWWGSSHSTVRLDTSVSFSLNHMESSIHSVASAPKGLPFGSDGEAGLLFCTPAAVHPSTAVVEALTALPACQRLGAAQQQQLQAALTPSTFAAGQLIVGQGVPGGCLYILASGQARILAPGGADSEGSCILDGAMGVCSFGDLALPTAKLPHASVVALSECMVWQLRRDAYAMAVEGPQSWVVSAMLRLVPALSCLQSADLDLASSLVSQLEYGEGHRIVDAAAEEVALYVVVDGYVSCQVRQGQQDKLQEVVLGSQGHFFFGLRLAVSTWKVVAATAGEGGCRLLRLNWIEVEELVGPLAEHVQAHCAWQERQQQQQQRLRRQPPTARQLLDLAALEPRGRVFTALCSSVLLMEDGSTHDVHTVRLTPIVPATDAAMGAAVQQVNQLQSSIQASLYVPVVARSMQSATHVAEFLATTALCSVAALTQQRPPLDEDSVRFLAAGLVLGLEHLHRSGIVFRSLSLHTVVLTEQGLPQLVDFSFAKKPEGLRTYSLAGYPEFLAPEQLALAGHTSASDWWALGILLYHLLAGGSPYAGAGASPPPGGPQLLDRMRTGRITIPASLSPEAQDLLSQLLRVEPAARLGVGKRSLEVLKTHSWFEGVSWEAMAAGEAATPEGLQRRIAVFEGLESAAVEAQPVAGTAPEWVHQFPRF